MRNIKKATAIVGEGITEKYYLKSLQGIVDATLQPIIPTHASSMNELEELIKRCVEQGFDAIYCLIDMDNKKSGKNKENYQRLKSKYHNKTITKKKLGTNSHILFFENERCLEMWFYFYFQSTTKEYASSDALTKELEKLCGYQKAEKFFIACKGLHHFLECKGGKLEAAVERAAESMKSKESSVRDYTYSEMADFFYRIKKK